VECVFAVGIQTRAASSSILSVGTAEDIPCGFSLHGNRMYMSSFQRAKTVYREIFNIKGLWREHTRFYLKFTFKFQKIATHGRHAMLPSFWAP
jgi:hypothetical protein